MAKKRRKPTKYCADKCGQKFWHFPHANLGLQIPQKILVMRPSAWALKQSILSPKRPFWGLKWSIGQKRLKPKILLCADRIFWYFSEEI
jgi:hypothetical protein